MPSYDEDKPIDTSSIEYRKTGIRLKKFVKDVFGVSVLEKIRNGELVIMFNGNEIKYNEKFSDHRVKEHTDLTVRFNGIDVPIDEDMFVSGNIPSFFLGERK